MNTALFSGQMRDAPLTSGDVVNEDVAAILADDLEWTRFSGKTVAVTGANGMLAAYIVETLLALNDRLENPVRVVALVRNPGKAQERFSRWSRCGNLDIRQWDYAQIDIGLGECNVLIHAASIPRPDSKRPADVIAPNVIGTWNLLDYARRECKSFEQLLFFSSCAVYGDSHLDNTPVSEDRSFPIDQMNPISCYAESKRMGENMCVSFMRQYGLPVKILRYAHTYGPGMDLKTDPRSFVQFIKCVLEGRDIELQTSGEMVRHFCYVTDATKAFFRILLLGGSGNAYNIANADCGISIRDLAQTIARIGGEKSKVLLNMGAKDKSGYAPQRFTVNPDTSRIKELGFVPSVTVEEGFSRVLNYYKKGVN